MSPSGFTPGISRLTGSHRRLLAGARIGLVSHPAAVDGRGTHAAMLLDQCPEGRLMAAYGPEHGFFCTATAGERVPRTRHPHLGIPVFSLYGSRRKPTRQMLRGVDSIVFDMQDIAARPYTFVGTLRYVMEAAAEYGKRVIVADRPIPLPCVIDGPMLNPFFQSFVSSIPAPMSYGMTPGETALWLKDVLSLDVALHVVKMSGYTRQPWREPDWFPWIPPSQGIRTWETAYCYAATVLLEGIDAVDHGRGTSLPFQLFGAPWLKNEPVLDILNAAHLPGIVFHPHFYTGQSKHHDRQPINGVRLTITDPSVFRPVATGVSVLAAIQRVHGPDALWKAEGTRPDFFDKIAGTDELRHALLDGQRAEAIIAGWAPALAAFDKQRRRHLLYKSG